jgi:hypothetical protein
MLNFKSVARKAESLRGFGGRCDLLSEIERPDCCSIQQTSITISNVTAKWNVETRCSWLKP